ncbi:MAG: alpha/beta fold hydrolase [Acholeplasmataceae bacterium]|nr:alpha/beta fold hydrolase [Acholeplasmataceae bacterium]
MQEEKVRFKDASIYYKFYGNEGKETILFLHPYASSGGLFENQITFFKREYQLLVIDLPGHGLSSVSKNVSFADGPEIIKVLLDELNISSCHIVSVSEGAIIAQGFAHIFPNKMKTLTVVSGFSIYHDSSKVLKSELRWTRFKNFFKWIFSFKNYKKYYLNKSAFSTQARKKFLKTMEGFNRNSVFAFRKFGRFYKLGKQTAFYPSYVVCGNYDLEVIKDSTMQYEQKVPLTTIEGYDNASQVVFLDNPRKFNDHLSIFLKSVESE